MRVAPIKLEEMQTKAALKLRVMLLAVLHQLFCPYGLLTILAAATFLVVGAFHGRASTASYILTGTPFFPVQIVVGLTAGYCIGRFLHWPLADWMWVVPASLLVFSMIFVPPPHGTSFWSYWFAWSGASGKAFPSLQSGLTMPLYLSAAYSVAAVIGQRTRHYSL